MCLGEVLASWQAEALSFLSSPTIAFICPVGTSMIMVCPDKALSSDSLFSKIEVALACKVLSKDIFSLLLFKQEDNPIMDKKVMRDIFILSIFDISNV